MKKILFLLLMTTSLFAQFKVSYIQVTDSLMIKGDNVTTFFDNLNSSNELESSGISSGAVTDVKLEHGGWGNETGGYGYKTPIAAGITPDRIGQVIHYIESFSGATVSESWWVATGTTSSDWVKIDTRVDDSSLEINSSSKLQVKAAGIDSSHFGAAAKAYITAHGGAVNIDNLSIDTSSSGKIRLKPGGTAQGNFDFNEYKITGLAEGSDWDDAVNYDNITEKAPYFKIKKNLFNRLKAVKGQYWGSGGVIHNGSTFARTDYIEVEPSTTYCVSGTNYYNYSAEFDSDKVYIGSMSMTTVTGGKRFTTSANARYIGLNITYTSTWEYINTFMVEKGSIVTDFEPMKFTLNTSDTALFTLDIADDITTSLNSDGAIQLKPDGTAQGNFDFNGYNIEGLGDPSDYQDAVNYDYITENAPYFKPYKNLFNKLKYAAGQYYNTSTGNIAGYADAVRTLKIEVEPSTTYALSGTNYYSGVEFDSSGAYIGALSMITITDGKRITTSANARYVGLNIRWDGDLSVINTFMMEKGSVVTDYEPMRFEFVDSDTTLFSVVLSDEELQTDQNTSILIKSGTSIYIRSYFDDDYDLTHRINTTSTNKVADLIYTYRIPKTNPNTVSGMTANGALIHSYSDDNCPWNTHNVGYIGAGHGLVCMEASSSGHDKDSTDIGSEWTDGTNNFYLAEIQDTILTFLGKAVSSGDSWVINYSTSADSLVHVSGATHTTDITLDSKSYVQQYPVTLNRSQDVYIDGNVKITGDTVMQFSQLDVVDRYDIVDPSTLNVSYPMDWSNGDVWLHNTIDYRYLPQNKMIIYYYAEVKREVDLSYMAFFQTAKIYQGSYGAIWGYIPKTKPIPSGSGDWDWTKLVDISTNPSLSMLFTSTYVTSTSNPPDRGIQFLGDSDTTLHIGYAHGYDLSQGFGRASQRAANNSSTYWQFYSSGKTYPRCISNMVIQDTVLNTIVYRQYFPVDSANYQDMYYYPIGDYYMVYVDYHTAVTDDRVELSQEMNGMSISVIDSSNVSLLSGNEVTSAGIVLTSTGQGYIVLKVY